MKPTAEEIDIALNVLLWLHEHTEDGRQRDAISDVRAALWDLP